MRRSTLDLRRKATLSHGNVPLLFLHALLGRSLACKWRKVHRGSQGFGSDDGQIDVQEGEVDEDIGEDDNEDEESDEEKQAGQRGRMRKRKKIKQRLFEEQTVQDSIERWWLTGCYIGRDNETEHRIANKSTEQWNFACYQHVYRVLHKHWGDGGKPNHLEEDWMAETDGKGFLDKRAVSRGLFEFAWLWCDRKTADEVSKFLDEELRRVFPNELQQTNQERTGTSVERAYERQYTDHRTLLEQDRFIAGEVNRNQKNLVQQESLSQPNDAETRISLDSAQAQARQTKVELPDIASMLEDAKKACWSQMSKVETIDDFRETSEIVSHRLHPPKTVDDYLRSTVKNSNSTATVPKTPSAVQERFEWQAKAPMVDLVQIDEILANAGAKRIGIGTAMRVVELEKQIPLPEERYMDECAADEDFVQHIVDATLGRWSSVHQENAEKPWKAHRPTEPQQPLTPAPRIHTGKFSPRKRRQRISNVKGSTEMQDVESLLVSELLKGEMTSSDVTSALETVEDPSMLRKVLALAIEKSLSQLEESCELEEASTMSRHPGMETQVLRFVCSELGGESAIFLRDVESYESEEALLKVSANLIVERGEAYILACLAATRGTSFVFDSSSNREQCWRDSLHNTRCALCVLLRDEFGQLSQALIVRNKVAHHAQLPASLPTHVRKHILRSLHSWSDTDLQRAKLLGRDLQLLPQHKLSKTPTRDVGSQTDISAHELLVAECKQTAAGFSQHLFPSKAPSLGAFVRDLQKACVSLFKASRCCLLLPRTFPLPATNHHRDYTLQRIDLDAPDFKVLSSDCIAFYAHNSAVVNAQTNRMEDLFTGKCDDLVNVMSNQSSIFNASHLNLLKTVSRSMSRSMRKSFHDGRGHSSKRRSVMESNELLEIISSENSHEEWLLAMLPGKNPNIRFKVSPGSSREDEQEWNLSETSPMVRCMDNRVPVSLSTSPTRSELCIPLFSYLTGGGLDAQVCSEDSDEESLGSDEQGLWNKQSQTSSDHTDQDPKDSAKHSKNKLLIGILRVERLNCTVSSHFSMEDELVAECVEPVVSKALQQYLDHAHTRRQMDGSHHHNVSKIQVLTRKCLLESRIVEAAMALSFCDSFAELLLTCANQLRRLFWAPESYPNVADHVPPTSSLFENDPKGLSRAVEGKLDQSKPASTWSDKYRDNNLSIQRYFIDLFEKGKAKRASDGPILAMPFELCIVFPEQDIALCVDSQSMDAFEDMRTAHHRHPHDTQSNREGTTFFPDPCSSGGFVTENQSWKEQRRRARRHSSLSQNASSSTSAQQILLSSPALSATVLTGTACACLLDVKAGQQKIFQQKSAKTDGIEFREAFDSMKEIHLQTLRSRPFLAQDDDKSHQHILEFAVPLSHPDSNLEIAQLLLRQVLPRNGPYNLDSNLQDLDSTSVLRESKLSSTSELDWLAKVSKSISGAIIQVKELQKDAAQVVSSDAKRKQLLEQITKVATQRTKDYLTIVGLQDRANLLGKKGGNLATDWMTTRGAKTIPLGLLPVANLQLLSGNTWLPGKPIPANVIPAPETNLSSSPQQSSRKVDHEIMQRLAHLHQRTARPRRRSVENLHGEQNSRNFLLSLLKKKMEKRESHIYFPDDEGPTLEPCESQDVEHGRCVVPIAGALLEIASLVIASDDVAVFINPDVSTTTQSNEKKLLAVYSADTAHEKQWFSEIPLPSEPRPKDQGETKQRFAQDQHWAELRLRALNTMSPIQLLDEVDDSEQADHESDQVEVEHGADLRKDSSESVLSEDSSVEENILFIPFQGSVNGVGAKVEGVVEFRRCDGKVSDDDIIMMKSFTDFVSDDIALWCNYRILSRQYFSLNLFNFAGVIFSGICSNLLQIDSAVDIIAKMAATAQRSVRCQRVVPMYPFHDPDGNLFLIEKDGAHLFSDAYEESERLKAFQSGKYFTLSPKQHRHQLLVKTLLKSHPKVEGVNSVGHVGNEAYDSFSKFQTQSICLVPVIRNRSVEVKDDARWPLGYRKDESEPDSIVAVLMFLNRQVDSPVLEHNFVHTRETDLSDSQSSDHNELILPFVDQDVEQLEEFARVTSFLVSHLYDKGVDNDPFD